MNLVKQIINISRSNFSKLQKETGIGRKKLSDFFYEKKKPNDEEFCILDNHLSKLIEEKDLSDAQIKNIEKKEPSKKVEKNLEKDGEKVKEAKRERQKRTWHSCPKGHYGIIIPNRFIEKGIPKCPVCGEEMKKKNKK